MVVESREEEPASAPEMNAEEFLSDVVRQSPAKIDRLPKFSIGTQVEVGFRIRGTPLVFVRDTTQANASVTTRPSSRLVGPATHCVSPASVLRDAITQAWRTAASWKMSRKRTCASPRMSRNDLPRQRHRAAGAAAERGTAGSAERAATKRRRGAEEAGASTA